MTYTLGQREDWEVPHGALDVARPRTPTRILLQTALTVGCALCAYTYLNDLSPRTRRKAWTQSAVQTVLFLNLPEFLPIQIMSAVMGMAIERLGLSQTSSLRRFAEITSLSRFKSGMHVQAIASSSIYKVAYNIPTIQACLFGLRAYVERFKISYHVATDVGNLGFDHRNGWLSAAGLLSGVLALFYRLATWLYKHRSQEDETELVSMSFPSDGNEPKEDSGPDPGLSGGLKWPRLSLETRVMLVEGFLASAIHQVPLAATHRKTRLFSLTGPLILIMAVLIVISTTWLRVRLATKAQLLLGVIALGFTSLTIVESLMIDFDELYAARAGILFPYNYRWQVTDRVDRFLRLII